MQNIGQFSSRIFEPLLKIALPLIENVLKPLAESVLTPFGLTVAASATDAALIRKFLDLVHVHTWRTTRLISNKEMNDIMKIVMSREEYGLLMKSVSETNKNEEKEQKGGYLAMLLGTFTKNKECSICDKY